jgi:2-oxoglutarate dehydrogenase E1 component
MTRFSYLKSADAGWIDETYARYLKDPNSVDPSWKYLFEGIELGRELADPPHKQTQEGSPVAQAASAATSGSSEEILKELQVLKLIEAYRSRGFLESHLNPLGDAPSRHPSLSLGYFGLNESDLPQKFYASRALGWTEAGSLQEILDHLRRAYGSTLACEVTHILEEAERQWLIQKIESPRPARSVQSQKNILKRLSEVEALEKFLHTRYVAQKRFSIEGGDGLIPALDALIEATARLGTKEIVLGMAHRGRLNVLAHVMGKKLEHLLVEFEGKYQVDPNEGEGDVKYHKGYSRDHTTQDGNSIHLSLAFNPSHLEFVNAIVTGAVRAKQTMRGDQDRTQVLPVLVHGDAAFAGQGVCYETANFMSLEGYSTGGTLHFVVNNQVGFTTNPPDSRSTRYCTDLGKMMEVPIFHVNGDDVETLVWITEVAAEYRQKFHKDVLIDIVCYRRHGHNEGDEPAFTQPLLYKKIKAHSTPREIYLQKLSREGVLSDAEGSSLLEAAMERLAQAQNAMREKPEAPNISALDGAWKGFVQGREQDIFRSVRTQVDRATLQKLSQELNTMPGDFQVHPKLKRIFESRLQAVQSGEGIDWGNAETLAFASLLHEGISVRLSGQDAERGTFTHRHAVLNDFETGKRYTPLHHISRAIPTQAKFQVHNSHLSETGVLGFEHGYALADPHTLVIWEAQFGDFANGAQVIIDQFIASSESKWKRMSGITLLLPHGYEGQGPEHSSARLERFLNLCGRENMVVANLSTPAQIFHALRRQQKWNFRKPLVIMSPKSLLRHPMAVSSLSDLADRGFQEVLDDPRYSADLSARKRASQVERILLCSGKVYYDLVAKRSPEFEEKVAILRLEQIYPWPAEKLREVLANYPPSAEILWVQEEPRNMGAWGFVFQNWAGGLQNFGQGRPLHYVGRKVGAAPAVGSPKLHEMELTEFLSAAFSPLPQTPHRGQTSSQVS